MDALQIDIHAEGQDAPASFFLIDRHHRDVAGLILLADLQHYICQHPAPAYSLTWSTGAGVGGFDFTGDLAAAIAQCAGSPAGPGALTLPPAFEDPAEESAAHFWIGLLSRAVRIATTGTANK